MLLAIPVEISDEQQLKSKSNSDQVTHLEANTCLQALIHTKCELCFFLQSWHQLKKLLERNLRFWPIFT